jgi:hypothetical protein
MALTTGGRRCLASQPASRWKFSLPSLPASLATLSASHCCFAYCQGQPWPSNMTMRWYNRKGRCQLPDIWQPRALLQMYKNSFYWSVRYICEKFDGILKFLHNCKYIQTKQSFWIVMITIFCP